MRPTLVRSDMERIRSRGTRLTGKDRIWASPSDRAAATKRVRAFQQERELAAPRDAAVESRISGRATPAVTDVK
jgi:hypothetical protein